MRARGVGAALCHLASGQVYFYGVGQLKNVQAAIRRGRALRCSRCNRPGATLGCRVERCPRTYHLPCARYDLCVFDHTHYLIACPEHSYRYQARLRSAHGFGAARGGQHHHRQQQQQQPRRRMAGVKHARGQEQEQGGRGGEDRWHLDPTLHAPPGGGGEPRETHRKRLRRAAL
eukprot:jgi/Mesen1/3404/ME000192S02573